MKLSRFLKNMNRGIALLIITVICFSGYVAYDYASFAAEKPEIEAFLKEYILKTASMSLLPEEERNFQNVSESAVKKKVEENKQIIDQYWTSAQIMTYHPDKRSVANMFEALFTHAIEKDPAYNGIILDAEVVIDQVKNIKKTSPNTAEANISFAVTYRYQGNPSLYIGWLQPANNKPVSDNKVRRFQNTLSADYGLLRTQNGWKLSCQIACLYGGSSVVVEGEEDNNGSSFAD